MLMSPRLASKLASVLLLTLPGSAWAGSDPLSEEVQTVFQRSSPAVVKIEAEDDNGPLSGTGFFVDCNGTIFTNYSVGGESHDIVVSFGAERYTASRVGADARSGLAILKLGSANSVSPNETGTDGEDAAAVPKTPFLPLGKSTDLNVASLVITVGYPQNLPITPTIGLVGGFGISYGNRYFAVSHIRANVPAQRGEAGAPLLNMNGQVVGIVESSLDDGNGCFVLPIEAAEKVQSDVTTYGKPQPGWLGIRVDLAGKPGKVEVQGFMNGSPAQSAGLRPGDIIQKVAGHDIFTLQDVLNAAFYMTAGEQTPLTIDRAGQTMEIKVVPTDNPAEALAEPGPSPSSEFDQPPPAISFSVRIGQ
jgi:S1-C subfamily serine protease